MIIIDDARSKAEDSLAYDHDMNVMGKDMPYVDMPYVDMTFVVKT